MTDGDCSSIYGSKDMDRTYVENCVRVESFKFGNKIDFEPLTGLLPDAKDYSMLAFSFEDKYKASINEKNFDIYYESLIQSRNSIYRKEYSNE